MGTDGPNTGLMLADKDLGGGGKFCQQGDGNHSDIPVQGWWSAGEGEAWKQDPEHHTQTQSCPWDYWTKQGLSREGKVPC